MRHYKNAHKTWKRRYLLQAQGHRCFYCLRSLRGLPQGQVTLDHLIPVKKGGDDRLENLVVCCVACNFKKDDRDLPADWVDSRRRQLSGG